MAFPAIKAASAEQLLKIGADYAKLLSGSAGRLVFSLAYFAAVANMMSVADFGLFAAASSVGLVLSRVAGLGFVSPLYRAATGRPRLVGTYTAGYLAALAVSLPVVALAGLAFHAALFRGELALLPFAAIAAAEILGWRLLEVVCIVNNGLGRFGRASLLVIAGVGIRSLAAVLFALSGAPGGLEGWSAAYLAANLLAAGGAIALLYPRQRLRWAPRLYLRRLSDSLAVAGAEALFYLQGELDKLLVLALGGAHVAGLYAMLMRLVDLTALPVRSFNTMLVQRIMRGPDTLPRRRLRWGIEAGIAFVSTACLAALGLVLDVAPTLLGPNVADAAPLVLLVLLVPAFRNLVEYQSELLYATGRTGVRAAILALVGLCKAAFLAAILVGAAGGDTGWVVALNGVFALLWLLSALATYAVLDGARRRRRPAMDPDAALATG